MESIQSLTMANTNGTGDPIINSITEEYTWKDSTTWSPWPWQSVGGVTAVPTPPITISEPFVFELYPAIPMISPIIDLGKLLISPVEPKEKKKFLRLIRPIKEEEK